MATEEERLVSVPSDQLVPGHAYEYDVETPGAKAIKDGVPYALASEDDLALYAGANERLAEMEIPTLAGQDDPNKHVFFAVFDGTGNDRHDAGFAPTGVAQIYAEIDSKIDAGWGDGRVAAAYIPGAASREFGDDWYDVRDGALGYTSDDRAETMYVEFCKQAAAWRDKDPNAEISIASMGFSRGAEEVALFTRLVDERGIQDPRAIKYETRDGGLVSAESVTITVDPDMPPLVAPGKVPQAAALVDPVPEGQLENRDRRLAPSVVSAVQLTARDETRDEFIGSRHLPLGLSDGNQSLNVVVPGAHADVGDGYYANGLGVRNTNFVKNYVNNLVDFDTPLLTLKPEDTYLGKGSTNVIHDSEEHKPLVYGNDAFRQDGERDVRAELNTPEPLLSNGRMVYASPIPEEDTRREPMDAELASSLDYRTATVAPPPTGDLYDPSKAHPDACLEGPPTVEVSAPSNASPDSPFHQATEDWLKSCEAEAPTRIETKPEPEPQPELVDVCFENGFCGLAPPPTEDQTDRWVMGERPPNSSAPLTVADSEHPANSLYDATLAAIENSPNIPPGSMNYNETRSAAAALVAAAMGGNDPLKTIDHVVLNRNGDGLIAIQGDLGDPASKRVALPMPEAVTTPILESTRKVDAVLEEQNQKTLVPPYNDYQSTVAPAMRAP